MFGRLGRGVAPFDINLLPWRARAAARRRRNFLFVLGMAVVLPVLGVSVMNLRSGRELTQIRADLTSLQAASGRVEDLRAERSLLLTEIEEAQFWLRDFDALLVRRARLPHIWGELALHLRGSMHLQRVELDEDTLRIAGVTNSSPDLATYMRRLEASPSFVAARLIDLADTSGGHSFAIEVGFAGPLDRE